MTVKQVQDWEQVVAVADPDTEAQDKAGTDVAAAVVAALSGCASGPTIITNSAPDFVLSDYRTFSFLDPLSTDPSADRRPQRRPSPRSPGW